MSTVIRPELSKNNLYWIPKHRYYELKHFCLQFPYWKKMYFAIDGILNSPGNMKLTPKSKQIEDETAKYALEKLHYSRRMDIVTWAATKTDRDLSRYILKAVTEGYSYEYLSTKLDIPCSRDTYYDRYRRFFWILDKDRD